MRGFRFSKALSARSLELITAEEGSEFLIGDIPALPFDEERSIAGWDMGVGINQADSIIFPLTPRLLIRMHLRIGQNRKSVASAVDVDNYNRLQVLNARQWAYYRPGSGFARRIPNWKTERNMVIANRSLSAPTGS